MEKDYRLERLYDYTKFHIGVYISAATALIALAGAEQSEALHPELIHHPCVLWPAIFFLAVAGLAGGIIVSTCTTVQTFDDIWCGKIGPWGSEIIPGRCLARIEHLAFWISAGLFAYAFY